jgi:hypothetical protein
MFRRITTILGAGVVCLAVGAGPTMAERQATPGGDGAGMMSLDSQQALVDQSCVFCHVDVERSGDMSLSGFDLVHPEEDPELTQKIIRESEENDYRFSSFIMGIVTSPAFGLNIVGESEN